MPVQLEFTLTYRDYYDAQLLHARRGWWPRLSLFMYRFGFPAWGFLLVIGGMWLGVLGVPRYAIAISVAAGLFLMSYPFYMRFRIKQCFRRTRTGDGSLAFNFDESGIRGVGQGTRTEIEWSAIQTMREDEKSLLLYLAPAKMLMIPKRVCSSAHLEELRRLFESETGAPHGDSTSHL